MARRTYGTGSLYQVKSGPQVGRWVGALSWVDAYGKRHRQTVSGTSKQAVARRLRSLSVTSHRTGDVAVADYLAGWLDTVAPTVRGSTLRAYERVVRNQIAPVIGSRWLADLTPDDVAYVSRQTEGSPGTKRLVHRVLSAALEHAYRTGQLSSNPARLVSAPRVPRAERPTWTAEQARQFLDATSEDDFWPLWVLALSTGARLGELLGLRWGDIDGDRLHIQRTVRQVSRYVYEEDEPKTSRSRRTLVLPALAVGALAKLPRGDGYIFARPDGRPWGATGIREALTDTCTRLGLPRLRFHDLRHTAAVLLLEASGGDLRLVQAQLGHESIRTTVDVYGGRADAAHAAGLFGSLLTEG